VLSLFAGLFTPVSKQRFTSVEKLKTNGGKKMSDETEG
jgi:hypothetical protein